MKTKVAIVIPNWNGREVVDDCLKSLIALETKAQIIVIDNGSSDGSVDYINQNYPSVGVVALPKNRGFAGGVNVGIKQAIKDGAKYIALFNNDAVADKNWLANLVERMESNNKLGIVTGKLMRDDKKHVDSTGEGYSVWGMPFPRGRNEVDKGQYDKSIEVFAATGGASLYRVEMLKQIGLFDEDFFAYFEDVDLSFRAQLAGWKVSYVPKAIAYHQIGATSGKLKGFTTYHSVKNFMLLYAKNMPTKLYVKYLLLFTLQLLRWTLGSTMRGKLAPFSRGLFAAIKLHKSTLKKRKQIQASRKVSIDYIDSMLYHHRPPRPRKL